jgi:hypothetical protein
VYRYRANTKTNFIRRFTEQSNKKKQVEQCFRFSQPQNEDKAYCREIGPYLAEAEIDYYLDEYDAALQQGATSGIYL